MSDFDAFARFHLIALHAQLERLKANIKEYSDIRASRTARPSEEPIARLMSSIDDTVKRLDQKIEIPCQRGEANDQFSNLINRLLDRREIRVDANILDHLK